MGEGVQRCDCESITLSGDYIMVEVGAGTNLDAIQHKLVSCCLRCSIPGIGL